MSGFKNKTPAEELIESLLKDVGEDSDESESSEKEGEETSIQSSEDSDDENAVAEFLNMGGGLKPAGSALQALANNSDFDGKTKTEYEKTRQTQASRLLDLNGLGEHLPSIPEVPAVSPETAAVKIGTSVDDLGLPTTDSMVTRPLIQVEKTAEVIRLETAQKTSSGDQYGDSEKTVAVAGYQVRRDDNYDDRVKVSVGQSRSTGFATWGSGSSPESNLAYADNLRIAQEKILELEGENEKLRLQNEELMAASEIIKERSDLLSSQLLEYKNDREGLEESYKNEIVLLKNHLGKKDSELQKAIQKSDELESRLKFDMKKIRVRERELENRLELIRAEKNAIVKNKDEQILDLRRKMDVLQMEVESYRQKCVELNKNIEINQESFKRTTRALRLAMANLELQEENKAPLKKAE